MFQTIIDKITSDASSELFFLLAGSLILYFLQVAHYWLKGIRFRRRVKSELAKYKKKKDAINVIDLANGDPEFKKKHIFSREVSILGQPRCLYIDIPVNLKNQILERERSAGYSDLQLTKFNPDTSFDGKDNFEDIALLTGIKNLPDLINEHRALIGEKFLNSEDGLIFNGEKYGVFNLRFTRFGDKESPGVEIDFFKTDYFTHRVFRSIYHLLKSQNHKIAKVGVSNFLQYKPFFTSFGINTLLICEGDDGKEIILSKRSARVHGGEPKYHITMNEGLSQTDKTPFGEVDLELCFKRGLLEELGITEKIYQLGVKA